MIKVTGHRGAGGLAPENTLAGFQKALSLGCHAVEFDVQLTRDGKLAVIHNETIEQTTNGRGPVDSYTMAELKQFDAGQGERIPELSEVLTLLKKSNITLQIELKAPGTPGPTTKLIKKWGMESRVIFTSFFHNRVLEAGKMLPAATIGILIACNPIQPLKLMEAAGADNLHVNHLCIDSALVTEVQRAGKKIVAWGTIVEIAVIDRLISLGVDTIGSDRPELVFKRLKLYSTE